MLDSSSAVAARLHAALRELVTPFGPPAYAAVVSDDGRTLASHQSVEVQSVDRRGAIAASLLAVARAAADDVRQGAVRALTIETERGAIVLRPLMLQRPAVLVMLVPDAGALARALWSSRRFVETQGAQAVP